jgi:hypothetical protein
MKRSTLYLIAGIGFSLSGAKAVLYEMDHIERLFPHWVYALCFPLALFFFWQAYEWKTSGRDEDI